ncbi:HNH endonuclease [Cupriavidus taiwanensis]|uniref:HNH nuclease domain-containing protein n=1 Tax=Cupriavidus taiwanensis TaxID=164546 RepID=A0A7Z7JIC7_9BURK|nr:HNH endonuclease [Cupriavidus taiwanensis]SOZ16999.1 conserved hypothetical protein [Cupriavidus taiwanensis]SOZ95919.1 conserved hypothetical protein [Cupriavidus taiwanensis]SPC25405.1 conserved hypothetical protein [Cupriavidus taiwanensis]SPD37650.1 conserved protein of unknown function [Cupriavidus taiwanensis]
MTRARDPKTLQDLTRDHLIAAARAWDPNVQISDFENNVERTVTIDERSLPTKPIVALAHEIAGLGTLSNALMSGEAARRRLTALDFSVSPPIPRKRAAAEQVRGTRHLQTEPKSAAQGARAQPLAHARARQELACDHVVAAALACANLPLAPKPDTYDVWLDGKPYPFWPLYRAAMKLSRGVVRKSRGPLRGSQPEHRTIRKLGFDVLPHGIRPVRKVDDAPDKPSPGLITVVSLRDAAVLLQHAPEFAARREGRTVDLWVEGNGPYPVKAMCLLAWHSLGLGWHENWIKGGPASQTNAHLQRLPGIELLPKDEAPDSDGGRVRAIVEDLQEIEQSNLSETTRKQLVDARLGQGRYRRELEEHWGAACAVTGVRQREALRASHIVPWKGSDNRTRLNPHNGLLLVATLDCLFDKWLITFGRDGELLIGPIPLDEQRKLGLDPKTMRLRTDGDLHLTSERLAFLERHRGKFLELHGWKDRFQNA